MMVDHNTEKVGLNYDRLLVEVDMNAKLPEEITFVNERGDLVEQNHI